MIHVGSCGAVSECLRVWTAFLGSVVDSVMEGQNKIRRDVNTWTETELLYIYNKLEKKAWWKSKRFLGTAGKLNVLYIEVHIASHDMIV